MGGRRRTRGPGWGRTQLPQLHLHTPHRPHSPHPQRPLHCLPPTARPLCSPRRSKSHAVGWKSGKAMRPEALWRGARGSPRPPGDLLPWNRMGSAPPRQGIKGLPARPRGPPGHLRLITSCNPLILYYHCFAPFTGKDTQFQKTRFICLRSLRQQPEDQTLLRLLFLADGTSKGSGAPRLRPPCPDGACR